MATRIRKEDFDKYKVNGYIVTGKSGLIVM